MNRARKPAVFRLDDPGIVVTPSEEPRSIAPPPPYPPPQAGEGRVGAAPAADVAPLPVAPPPSRRRVPWAGLFWVSAAGLVLLATGLGIANLIEDLLNRAAWLGGIGAVPGLRVTCSYCAIVPDDGPRPGGPMSTAAIRVGAARAVIARDGTDKASCS